MSDPPEKQLKVVPVATLSLWNFEDKIGTVIKTLQALCDKHGPDATFDYGQHDQYDDSFTFELRVQRLETDAEYEIRVQQEQKQREQALIYLQRQAKAYGLELTPKNPDTQ